MSDSVTERYRGAVPVIATEDVVGSVRYFETTLGFRRHFVWGDPPVYAAVKAAGALIYLSHDPDVAAAIRERRLAPEIFVWVDDIDTVYARHRAAGAEIVEELTARPWDARQYVLREPNGYWLKIAEPIDVEDDDGDERLG